MPVPAVAAAPGPRATACARLGPFIGQPTSLSVGRTAARGSGARQLHKVRAATSSPSPLGDPHRILGVEPGSDQATIKKAFRRLALRCVADSVARAADTRRGRRDARMSAHADAACAPPQLPPGRQPRRGRARALSCSPDSVRHAHGTTPRCGERHCRKRVGRVAATAPPCFGRGGSCGTSSCRARGAAAADARAAAGALEAAAGRPWKASGSATRATVRHLRATVWRRAPPCAQPGCSLAPVLRTERAR